MLPTGTEVICGPGRCHPPRQPLPAPRRAVLRDPLFYTNEPDTPRQSRIAHSNIYPNPQHGDHVLIEAVLNVITEIKKKG